MSTVTLNAVFTLDDVAKMAMADKDHFYELTPEGTLLVSPPPTYGHQRIAARVLQWLTTHGYGERVALDVGMAVARRAGGRVPDVVVTAPDAPEDGVYLDPEHVRLVAEIVSAGSVDTDRHTKPREYAAAGIPHFWRVDRPEGEPPTVHLFRRQGTEYVPTRTCPLDELLTETPPALDE